MPAATVNTMPEHSHAFAESATTITSSLPKEKKMGFGGKLGASLTTLKKVMSATIGGGSGRKPSHSMGAGKDEDYISLGSLVDDMGTLGLENRKTQAINRVSQISGDKKPAFGAQISASSVITIAPTATKQQTQTSGAQICSSDDSVSKPMIAQKLKKTEHQSIAQQPAKQTSAKSAADINNTTQSQPRFQSHPFSWNDFERVRTIGSGSYGCVSLCRHKRTGNPCVIKAVSKSYAFAKREQQHALNEKEILSAITRTDCPFTSQVYGYFQDAENLYYVLEYVPGGELFTYMVEYDTFDDTGAKFFVAQVAVAFQHMHSMGIAYRDCKPENMLVDEKGYVKICDFGFSRFVPRGDHAYTMCGTPEYIAPEILRGKGHGLSVDLWSLGIFAYELLVGRTPFEGSNSRATHVNILNGPVRFPDYVSADARDFITSLLNRDETERLGCGREGFASIFQHPWLASVDLDKLRRRELPSPIPVKVSGLFDSRNFDRFAPEESRSAGCPALTPEQELLFADFDYVAREFAPVPTSTVAANWNCDVYG